MPICDRCGQPAETLIMEPFDAQHCCPDCIAVVSAEFAAEYGFDSDVDDFDDDDDDDFF